MYFRGSCGAEFAFAFEVAFEKGNVTIYFVTFSSVTNVKLSHFSETKRDNLAISTIVIFGPKNVKCADG